MSEEDDELISRNFQIVKSAKQKLKLTKRIPLKSEIKKREYISDARRTYSQLLLNAFNSCDIDKLKNVYAMYCRPDLHAVNLYEGKKNPTGANSTELKTVPILLSYWQTLFHSAPDFMFESQFVTAYTDTISNISVVKSKFRMTGTRIMDVKIAQKTNADVIKKKLKHKEQYSTSENELMLEINNQLVTSFDPVPAAAESEAGPAGDDLSRLTKIETTTNTTNTIENADQEIVDHDDLFLDELIVLAGDLADNHSVVPSSHSSTTMINPPFTLLSSNSTSLTVHVPDNEVSPVETGSTLANEDNSTDINIKKRKVTPRNASAESKTEKALQREIAKKAKAEAAKVSSIFASGEAIVFTEDAQVYADKPLAEILHLKYKGTFAVYLDANNKIFRYEFIYTALDDANSIDGTLSTTAATVESSNNENHTNEEEEED
eukprot:gene17591-20037_t